MSKFKFVNIVDTIFLAVAVFLIIFAWLQFFLKNIILSLMLGVVLALAVMLMLRFFHNKKYTNKQNALNKNSELAHFKLAIQTMPSVKLTSTIKKLIPKTYSPTTKNGDISFVKDEKTHLFTFYFSNELNEAKLLEIIKLKKAQNLCVFCSSFTKEAKLISTAFKNKKIELITLEQLFEMFNQQNITIDTQNIDLNKSKITLKEILKNSISRDKSKGYFISGLVLLFTSIIIPYRIYYVIFSTALIALSLLCRLRPTTKIDNNLFD